MSSRGALLCTRNSLSRQDKADHAGGLSLAVIFPSVHGATVDEHVTTFQRTGLAAIEEQLN